MITKTWLITGCAGFIGSNLLETLLLLDQKVIGLDNFATGHQHNLDEVKGQALQISEGCVSRSKIVHGNTAAKFFDFTDKALGLFQ